MFFEKHPPMIPGQTLEDPRSDYRSAEKIGSFRVSEQAFYPPNGTYLLRSSIQSVFNDRGVVHVSGCCAGGIPTPRLVVITPEKKFQFLCDNDKTALRLVAALSKES